MTTDQRGSVERQWSTEMAWNPYRAGCCDGACDCKGALACTQLPAMALIWLQAGPAHSLQHPSSVHFASVAVSGTCCPAMCLTRLLAPAGQRGVLFSASATPFFVTHNQ